MEGAMRTAVKACSRALGPIESNSFRVVVRYLRQRLQLCRSLFEDCRRIPGIVYQICEMILKRLFIAVLAHIL